MRRSKKPALALKGLRFDEAKGIAYLSCYVPGGKGVVRHRATVPAETLEEAVECWKEFRESVVRGRLRPRSGVTLREFVDGYFDDIRAQVSPRTAESYSAVIRNHLLPEFGHVRLDDITTAAVTIFETKLKRRGYALATVNGYVNVLLILLHKAVDDFDVIEEFPLKKRLKRKRPPALALELNDDERLRFLGVFDDECAFRRDLGTRRVLGPVRESSSYVVPRRFGASTHPESEAAGDAFARFQFMKPFFVIAVETGLRRGDLLRLTWRSVDLEERWITVVMQKTKLPVTVPLSVVCVNALETCRERRGANERVFVDESGDAISDMRVKRAFERAKRLAGITRRFRFHDLRHTYGSRLASKDVPIQVISKAMGHTSISTTMRYARPSMDALRSIQRALDGS